MSNALTNDLCRRLGIRLPIFGLAHRIEVAAAISRAGGLGVYAAARDGPHELQKKLRQLRAEFALKAQQSTPADS